jgi:diadenosine tetraphosphatase ApaH/serine/threonine PP2A family protein phosphatase
MGANPSRRKRIPWYEIYRGEKIVPFGHWPGLKPRRGRRAMGLDTGCAYGGRLTGYLLEANQLISVPARRVYDRLQRKLR